MTNIRGINIGRTFRWVSLLAFAVGLSFPVRAQSVEDKPVDISFSKCWDISTSVLSEQGVSADDSQAYYVSSDGKIAAIELRSGTVAWTAEVGGKPLSELVLAGGKIYTIAMSGWSG